MSASNSNLFEDSSDSDDNTRYVITPPQFKPKISSASRTLQQRLNHSMRQRLVPLEIGRVATELVIALMVKIAMKMHRLGNRDEDFGTNKDVFICNMRSTRTGKLYTNSRSDVPFTAFKVLVFAGLVKEINSWIGVGEEFRVNYPKGTNMNFLRLSSDIKTHVSNYVEKLESDKKWVRKVTIQHDV